MFDHLLNLRIFKQNTAEELFIPLFFKTKIVLIINIKKMCTET